ncbi:hypothetical protein COV23_01420 [Candidatus Wolfebacteria bacterium CG10_big_fil_rev_8_21_14_0_10_31_9]|uniref:SCP domain-containing protein n=1 Tax=Candidatus Wolfebacteria bacterium CG10_big_fil_rev_8_21_14_0_10_31_9 TaxID=1975070 RepID=A0A2H0RE98_9BACT|nr:MAG: hypothetical protein COV23_01420 [Candidatus Wolfebacteria bacterium CG10_big_fil_rev_8_21_14_0_10_31_9]
MNKVIYWFKKYFIPHHHNDHKPHFLRIEATVVILIIVLIFEIFFIGLTQITGFTHSRFFASILPSVLIDSSNKNRINNNERPLVVSPILEVAAQMKADDMAKRSYFSHTDTDGNPPWAWFKKANYSFTYAGENLAINFSDSQDVVKAWMNSIKHKENILNSHFTEIGIGAAQGYYNGEKTIFIVQFFGTPAQSKAQAAQPTINNITSTPIVKPVVIKVVQVNPKESTTSIAIKDSSTTSVAGINTESFVSIDGNGDQIQTLDKDKIDKISIPKQSSWLNRFLVNPHAITTYFYVILFAIIFLALMLKIFIKIKIQRPPLIINGVFMLIVIASVLLINQYIAINSGAVF